MTRSGTSTHPPIPPSAPANCTWLLPLFRQFPLRTLKIKLLFFCISDKCKLVWPLNYYFIFILHISNIFCSFFPKTLNWWNNTHPDFYFSFLNLLGQQICFTRPICFNKWCPQFARIILGYFTVSPHLQRDSSHAFM